MSNDSEGNPVGSSFDSRTTVADVVFWIVFGILLGLAIAGIMTLALAYWTPEPV